MILQTEEAGGKIVGILGTLTKETKDVSASMRANSEKIRAVSSISTPGVSKAKELDKIFTEVSRNMDQFSDRVSNLIPEYGDSIEKLEEGQIGQIESIDPTTIGGLKAAKQQREVMTRFLASSQSALPSLIGFRESVVNLKNLNMSSKISRAADRQSTVLDDLISSTKRLEAFGIRVLSVIEKKLAESKTPA